MLKIDAQGFGCNILEVVKNSMKEFHQWIVALVTAVMHLL
jgi:hypothetical protein